jgi:hypothetical protein
MNFAQAQIIWKFHSDGGFSAFDLTRQIASYAYPTSDYAQSAKSNPENTALRMLYGQRNTTAWDLEHIAKHVWNNPNNWLPTNTR